MSRQNRGDKRRAQILAAAERLFRRQGFAATSMRQIAAEAGFGTAVSGLYNHYPNKEALFKAVLMSRSPYDQILAAMENVEGDTLEHFLPDWLGTIWPIMNRHMDFMQLVFIDLQEFDGRILSDFLSTIIPHFFTLFSRLQSLPGVRQDLPLPILARTIASAMIGYLFTEVIARRILADQVSFDLAQGEKWLEGLVGILVRGLSDGPAQP